ncbi:DUF6880 family protein [Puniceibacterium sediminis]|uniref:Uncharacterized protein n=1 Tax=Puniceibacterium sediminis TaxID=1608407 RepID=A0A238WED4_9RHOB|nr:DUF6880 family protein [Puniceibacterium sediminis]SNR44915.1 hypothetical protein SAMN06265370_105156 [Puniceibacterium sediminis]
MASKTTLNAKNLETLGAARLAELVIEISTGSAVAKRRLRLELAGAQSPKEAAREVARRLTSIARARSFVNWKNRKPLVTDLESQLRAIKEQIARDDPAEGLALLWRFMQVATPLFERCDDSSGIVIEVFHDACVLLGEIALAAGTPPEALADTAIDALRDNGYGQYDGLIAILTPALGEVGLAHLKQRIETMAATPVPVPPKGEWEAVGYGGGGATYAHQMEERSRQSMVGMALKDIADAMGDVDAFIAQYDPKTRKVPKIAAEIAARLLAAGRAEDALGFIERAEVDNDRWVPRELQDTRLEVLEALDRKDEAQAFRWSCFESTLNSEYLRDFLKRLPDFEDIEAEERAMDHAAAHSRVTPALGFFLDWPSPDRAARLLIDRHAEINGDHYEFLVPAAEATSERHPLAATLALRAMIDFTLLKARSKRYGYAAQHLAECAALADRIEDFDELETHVAYLARLKSEHGRKYGFWSLTEA